MSYRNQREYTYPYIRESRAVFIRETVVIIPSATLLGILTRNKGAPMMFTLMLIILVLVMYIVEFFLNYRLGILAYIDSKREEFEVIDARITDYKPEHTFTGRHQGLITSLYPKDLYVMRYKLLITDANGEKHFIRTVMSHEKSISLYNLKDTYKLLDHVQITYCKRSRIMIDLNIDTSGLIRKRDIAKVDKLIRKVNQAI